MSFPKIFTKIPQTQLDIETIREPESHSLSRNGGNSDKWHASFRLIFSAVITIIGFSAGFYLLLSKDTSDDTKKFGAGLIGLVVGHWLS